MAKQISKIVEIPISSTKVQMESALDNYLNNDYELVNIFALGTKTYAVLIKKLTR